MSYSIGTLSYAAAALAYFLLAVLLVTSWRGRLPGGLLAAASVATGIWASAMAYQAIYPDSMLRLSMLLETAQKATWFAFLLVLLGYALRPDEGARRGLRKVALAVLGFCAALILIVSIWPLLGRVEWFREWRFAVLILGSGLLALIGMLLVEHLYRNTNPQQRWSLKFLCLGLGAYFAFDFYLYSDALLFRRINPDIWDARGVVIALIAPLIAVSAARNPTWSLDVSISRRLVLHSTTLLGASIYLLVMALAGYYIRYFGGSWGGLLQIAFLFGAGMLLVLMLFSGTLRSQVKIFLSKHFFSYRYDYREEWLRFTRALSEGELGSRVGERCIEALAGLVESPAGALWTKQERGAFERIAHWNMPAAIGTEAANTEFTRYLAHHQSVLSLEEQERNPEVYGGLVLPEWLRAVEQAWVVVPLVVHDELIGFVILARSRGRMTVNWEVSDLLRTAGRQAATYLGQVQAAEALARARQFESFNRMSAFVVHDLKNLVAQLSLLLSNAKRHKHNPEFQEDMLATVENSIAKMNRMLMQLRSGGAPIEKPVAVSVTEVVRRAVESKSAYCPAARLEVLQPDLWVAASAERLERVVGHLVQNAIEATPQEGSVIVRVARNGTSAVIEVEDTGKGMSESFVRNELFKPFESTKRTGMGIGSYESREYVRELGGQIEVHSREGEGTRFVITLPLTERMTAAVPAELMRGAA